MLFPSRKSGFRSIPTIGAVPVLFRSESAMRKKKSAIVELIFVVAMFAIFAGCASTKPKSAGKDEAMLPEIDVVQVKEY